MSHILLVDNDPGTTSCFEMILRRDGYRVSAASTGAEALSLLVKSAYDLALVDLRLGETSGLDFIRAARSEGCTTAFIVISGFPSVRDAVVAMQLGALNVLEKPVFEDQLLEAVRRAVLGADRAARHDRVAPHDSIRAHAAARWAGR